MVDVGPKKELKVNDAMKTKAMPATAVPPGRSAGRVALALGAFLAAVLLWTVPAQAWEGFYIAKMEPDQTQAGGHPNVSFRMNWDNSTFRPASSATRMRHRSARSSSSHSGDARRPRRWESSNRSKAWGSLRSITCSRILRNRR